MPTRLLPGMFGIASWKAGVIASRSCEAGSAGTMPGHAATAANASNMVDRAFILISPALWLETTATVRSQPFDPQPATVKSSRYRRCLWQFVDRSTSCRLHGLLIFQTYVILSLLHYIDDQQLDRLGTYSRGLMPLANGLEDEVARFVFSVFSRFCVRNPQRSGKDIAIARERVHQLGKNSTRGDVIGRHKNVCIALRQTYRLANDLSPSKAVTTSRTLIE